MLRALLLFALIPAAFAKHVIRQTYISSADLNVLLLSHNPERTLNFDLLASIPKNIIVSINEISDHYEFSLIIGRAGLRKKLNSSVPMIRGRTDQKTFVKDDLELTIISTLECAKDFYGPLCDQVCQSDAHQAVNKRCDDLGRIRCDYGWMGPQCSQAVDPRQCGCQNQGICVSTKQFPSIGESPDRLTCECRNGFQGDVCEIATRLNASQPTVDACTLGNLCMNGAQCFSNGPKYFCACQPGFFGNYCELNGSTDSPDSTTLTLSTLQLFVIILSIAILIVGCFTYKRRHSRLDALARLPVIEPFEVAIPTRSMLVNTEQKVFTIDDGRYSSAPTKKAFEVVYSEIQKPPPPPTIPLPEPKVV
ncbi:unnamed protein product [Caenorhabditis bovis]|uniref:Delta-like protein n=1 Tax=Caenorhabditis bovis TaxID=2654633 RepID=A0A8S1E842_9PELO|nr:unnamed protein product [Caenorhabditis bovis]